MEEAAHAAGETVEAVDGVHLTALAVGERMSLQHFHIEPGAVVPEHSHPHEQAGYVTHGTFTVAVEGAEYVIDSGDSYVIPGDESHRAENRADEPVRGVDVFSPPREDPAWRD